MPGNHSRTVGQQTIYRSSFVGMCGLRGQIGFYPWRPVPVFRKRYRKRLFRKASAVQLLVPAVNIRWSACTLQRRSMHNQYSG